MAAQCVANLDRHLVRSVRADPMQEHVHAAKPRHTIHQFDAVEGIASQLFLLFTIQLVVLRIGKIIVGGQQESARAARRIADRHLGLRTHHVDNRRNQGPGRKVLSRAAFHVLGVLLEQPFVSVALHVRRQRRPLFLVDEIDNQPPELRRVLNLILRLAKDDAEHALFFAERLQQMAIMNFQLVAVLGEQTGPVEAFGNGRPFVERRLGSAHPPS